MRRPRRHLPLPVRPCARSRACLAVCLAVCLVLVAGCGKRPLPGYGQEATAAPAARAAGPAGGLVDVICRPGTGEARGVPDSLFNCLLHARDTGLGTVELPRGVYLGHVAEFIVRALKFYDVEGHFERFYGYRVVLRLRPATEDETGQARRDGMVREALGAAGDATLLLAGAAWVPLTPIVFLFETAGSDAERQRWVGDAERAGLPRPDRSSGEVVLGEYRRRYAMLLGGDDEEAVMQAWVVEQCYLERPDVGEVVDLAARWNGDDPGPPPRGQDFPSQAP